MSGIGGLVNLDGRPVAEEELRGVQEALLHRGPDHQALWIDGNIGLIHNLLRIEPQARQPFLVGRSAVAFDGRIDNLPLLRKILERAGRRWSPLADPPTAPELLLEAYLELGEGLLPLLLGDFALALWDGPARKLLLARDPVGVKPLFYFQDEKRLIFASEIKGLLAAGAPCERDDDAFGEFRIFRFRTMRRTFFKGIRRLPPGFLLVAPGRESSGRAFWGPNPGRHLVLPSREAYRERFRSLFLEAVRCRLPQAGPAALRLSGGLDSSSIAGACARIRDRERPGLSIAAVSILSDAFPDERRHISAACGACGLESLSFLGEDVDLLDGIETVLHHQESPLFEPMDAWILRQHRLAGERGCRVVLGGEWGDQLMCSGAYIADLFRQGRWPRFVREFLSYPRRSGGSYRGLARLLLLYLALPGRVSDRYESLRRVLYRLARPGRPVPGGMPGPWTGLVEGAPEFLGPAFPLAARRERYDAVFGVHNVLCLELLDKLAAQSGVEARLPFLDRRLIQFCLSVPSEEIVRGGLDRRLQREGLEGLLPASIAARPDKGDYTDLERACLGRLGFSGDASGALDRWRSAMEELWERTWIKRAGPGSGRNTRPLALSSTET